MSYPHHHPQDQPRPPAHSYPSQPQRAHSPNPPYSASPSRGPPSPYQQYNPSASPPLGPYDSHSTQSHSQVFYPDELGEKVPLTHTAAPIAGQALHHQTHQAHLYHPPQQSQYPPHRAYSQGASSIAASEDDWRRRARPIQRGITRRVKLTQGNFINDYPYVKILLLLLSHQTLISTHSLQPSWF